MYLSRISSKTVIQPQKITKRKQKYFGKIAPKGPPAKTISSTEKDTREHERASSACPPEPTYKQGGAACHLGPTYSSNRPIVNKTLDVAAGYIFIRLANIYRLTPSGLP